MSEKRSKKELLIDFDLYMSELGQEYRRGITKGIVFAWDVVTKSEKSESLQLLKDEFLDFDASQEERDLVNAIYNTIRKLNKESENEQS